MAITIDPFKSSFKDDFKAQLFCEEWAERINCLRSLNNVESDFDRDQAEKDIRVRESESTNFKLNDEKLLKSSLDSLRRSHEYELEALKREKRYARTPYSDKITEELAENSKKYLLDMCELCKEQILFVYTIKNKILTTYNNSFVCFEDKFLDPANKNKVFRLDFYLYCADKIFEGALKFAKNYLNVSLDNYEMRNYVASEYRKFLIQLQTIKNDFNGYTEKDASREVPWDAGRPGDECCPCCSCNGIVDAFMFYSSKQKNEDEKETRCVPFDIFIEKFRNCKKAVSKLVDEISDYIGDSQKKLIKIVENIDKINGDATKGRNAISEVRTIFYKLNLMTSCYLKNLYDLCDTIFDSLNKTEIIHRK